MHGGLRYLYNLDFKLVAEALKERGLLLERTAPTWSGPALPLAPQDARD